MNPDSESQISLPTVQPIRTFSYTRIVEIPTDIPFPQNLFSFHTYNSWKIFSLAVLALTLCGFAFAIFDPILHPDNYTKAIEVHIDNRGIIKKGWGWIYSIMWQDTPKDIKIIQEASQRVTWNRTCGFVGVILAWLFIWMCFDWGNAQRRVYCVFLVGFGIVYAIAPIDIIPDFLPFLGQIDDVMIAIFGIGLGISSLLDDLQKKKADQDVADIMKEHPETGMRLLLKKHGLKIEQHSEKNS